jgi:hypothetical protein
MRFFLRFVAGQHLACPGVEVGLRRIGRQSLAFSEQHSGLTPK